MIPNGLETDFRMSQICSYWIPFRYFGQEIGGKSIRFIPVRSEALIQMNPNQSEPSFQSELIQINLRSECSRLKTWFGFIRIEACASQYDIFGQYIFFFLPWRKVRSEIQSD